MFDKVDPNVEWAPLMPRKPEPKVNRYWVDDYKVNEPSKFYIDGSSPTDTYYEESIPQGQSAQSWAYEGGARQMGWSPQINPWSKPLGRNADAALARDASTYTGLTQ